MENIQHKRNKVVLERLLAYYEDEPEILADILEGTLDMIAQDDGFGTEQQCDPRGDQRDAEQKKYFYTMYKVQGVDD